VTEPIFEIDAAWQALTKARGQGDNGAESIALTVLGQALVEAGREDALFFEQQAIRFGAKEDQLFAQAEVLLRRAEALEAMGSTALRQVEDRSLSEMTPLELSAGPGVAGGYQRSQDQIIDDAARAYWRAAGRLRRLGARRAAEAAQQRSDELLRRTPPEAGRAAASSVELGTLAVGFMALKLLGPFLEAFAKKLGDQLGESVARALGRVRLARWHTGAHELEAELPGPTVLRFELPEDFTDAAKLAIIEFDLATHPSSVTLHWNQAMAAWQEEDKPQNGSNAKDTD